MKLPWSDPRLPSALQRALLMAAGVASVFAWVTATRVVYLQSRLRSSEHGVS